ncbi:hypothetical protein HY948_04875 [Candidatus Gottesmanbacteria bacterium]|nr:hypothetical protein [Candidatus Gottesmanbacteria bacterium]
MNLLALDALLLFSLSVPVVMRYRIFPVTGTPYWLFGILFFVLLINVLISMYPGFIGKEIRVLKIKLVLLIVTVMIVLGGTMVTAMVDRSKTAPVYGVHDIILQQEAAMRYLISGKNPYKETYFGTPLESWHYAEEGKEAVNPALYHFVMPPWYLLSALPFYAVAIPLFGFFDGRMQLLFSAFGVLALLLFWFRNKSIAFIAVALTALSPATVDYLIEGRSDIFALFWLMCSLYSLEKKRYVWSSLLFSLAILSKQTVWLALPFYGIYAWISLKKITPFFVKIAVPATGVLFVLAGPFLLWDYRAFVESTILYLSGGSAFSYPVSGYGLGMVLREAGVVRDIHAYYPFFVWQIVLAIPVLGVSLGALWKRGTMSRLLIGYGAFLFVWWWASRYFNNSHVGYLSSIFALGILKDLDEKET